MSETEAYAILWPMNTTVIIKFQLLMQYRRYQYFKETKDMISFD